MMVYHASVQKLTKPLIPRVPANTLPNEDSSIKRVCFSASINGCLSSIDALEFGDTVYIYMANIDPYFPTPSQVPDSIFFGEVWSLQNVCDYIHLFTLTITGYIGCEVSHLVNNQYSYILAKK